MARVGFYLLAIWTLVPFTDSTTTRVTEAIENEVTVAFYIMPKSTFIARRDTFQTLMADAANSHCTLDYQGCGLQSGWNYQGQFEKEDVEISSEDDTTEKTRLLINYYINLPRNVSATNTKYVLNKNAVYSIVAASRIDIHSRIGYSVVKAGSLEFSPYPDVTVNAIMITLAVLVTLFFLAFLICCRRIHWHKEMKAYEAAITAKRPQTYGKKEEAAKRRRRAIADYKEKHPIRPSTVAKLSPSHTKVRPEETKAINTNPLSEKRSGEVHYPRPYRRGENRSSAKDYDDYDSSDTYQQPTQQPRTQTLNVSSFYQSPNSDDAYRDYYSHDPNNQPRTLAPLSEEELKRQRKKAKKAKKKQKKLEEELAATGMRDQSYENGSYTTTEHKYRPPGPDADSYGRAPSDYDVSYRQESAAMNIPAAPSYNRDYQLKDSTNSDNSDSGLNSVYSRSLSNAPALKSTEV